MSSTVFANHTPHRKLEFVSVCLDMCSIFICFQHFSYFGSLTASVLLSCYLSFSCSSAVFAAFQQQLTSFTVILKQMATSR